MAYVNSPKVKWGLLLGSVAAVALAGELILEGIIELADLLLEITQAALMKFYEHAFDMDHELAQHRAAWTTMIGFILSLLIAGKVFGPGIKRRILARYNEFRGKVYERKMAFAALPWYWKGIYGFFAACVLILMVLII
ncbi:MAG: hypothetical protein RIQ52_788 [Pseudomonadota bacterium]|jgi:hypothetical protein